MLQKLVQEPLWQHIVIIRIFVGLRCIRACVVLRETVDEKITTTASRQKWLRNSIHSLINDICSSFSITIVVCNVSPSNDIVRCWQNNDATVNFVVVIFVDVFVVDGVFIHLIFAVNHCTFDCHRKRRVVCNNTKTNHEEYNRNNNHHLRYSDSISTQHKYLNLVSVCGNKSFRRSNSIFAYNTRDSLSPSAKSLGSLSLLEQNTVTSFSHSNESTQSVAAADLNLNQQTSNFITNNSLNL
ncbi:hypothetical protein CVS40_7155 [Lucilia cuprina]|nr:hypothetical protein CVS40_7155 [Lucilia cuprina]